MASSPAPPAEPRPRAAAKVVEYEDFVDQRIQQTRSAVKTADLVTGLVTLFAWTLFVLLVSAVADHWLVAGGFTRTGRFALFAVGAIGGLLYLATRLAPRLLGRVNPLYAAQEIEKESPQLKNSLLNLLQLRDHPASAAAVRQTLERQAAERLASAGDAPIDRSPLLRAAKFVLALVAVIGVYVVASPKDFFASAGRVLAPWADIAAPSRVQFNEVTPGDLELAQGERLEIGSMVTGLRDDEIVEVVFTTSDGSAVERRTPMRASELGVHHTASLPAGGGAAAALGLQGDLTYRLEAGDARTRNYRATVIAAPTIAPTLVRYEYPEYTGYVDREVEGIGDVRAIEGTRVTVTAGANLPIESAQIDLGADGRPDVRMRPEGRSATGSFTLQRDSNEPGDTATSYVLRFTATDGQANHDPPQYRVEVIADLAPEIEVVAPEEPRLQVRLDERVLIRAIARDPDFALSSLRLVGEARGERVLEEDLLSKEGRGKVEGEAIVVPRKLGLQPGDTLDYWIEASDTRTPEANKTTSSRRRLLIVGPAEENPQQGDERGGEGVAGSPERGDPEESRRRQLEERQQFDQQRGPRESEQNKQQGETPSGENQPGQSPNEKPEEQEQEGDGREPSPGGLRAPGEGGDSGEKQGDPNAGQNPGGDDSESGDDSDSASAAGDPSEAREQPQGDRNQPNGQPGEQQQRGGGDPNEGEPNDAGEQGGNADTPTARDGSDDGSAFEKMLDYLKNQQENGAGEPQDGANQASDPGSESSNDNGEAGQEKAAEDGQGETGEEKSNEKGSNTGQSRDPANDGSNGESQRGANPEGTDSQGASRGDQEQGESPAQAERPEEGPGAGEEDRQGDASDSTTSESGGETPPGQESDPRAGPREGTGDSGQNQAADQGAGRSSDEGAGESTGESGGQEESDGSTGGQQDKQRSGQGEEGPSDSSDKPDGQRPGESPQSQGDGSSDPTGDGQGPADGSPIDGAEGPDSPIDRRGEGPDRPAGDNAGDPVGVGDRGPNSGGAGAGSEPGGDEANLDYAREQTELVLNQLEDQLRQKQVDPELLDRLGWSEQDLRRFVERWRSRRRQAAERGAEGEAELDRALRSLGIRPEGPTATRTITAERLKELRQQARQQAPPRLREQLDLYNRSLNATPKEE